nr:ulp1 protease family, C-terminal catalytic domain-containing protein [Tanacetum cinerariifolium]
MINISKLEQHLFNLSKCDWEFNLGFLILFFSIFGLGNKDGTVNERIILFLPNTDDVSKMDWCSYALECMVKGCKEYKLGKYFSGPLLLMATVKVEKTAPAFKAWNYKLLLKRNKKKSFRRFWPSTKCGRFTKDVDATEDIVDKNEDFKSLYFEVLFFKKGDADKNGNTNENPLEKGHNEETEGEEIEEQEIYGESNEDESQNESEHHKSQSINIIGNLSLSAVQNTNFNEQVESIVNATVESTVDVVAVLPQICVQIKGSGTSDVETKKQVEVEKYKVIKEKRTIKTSSNFYDRRINISEPISEEEKKLVEYIWSDSCPKGLYPEIKVDATVIDAWSDVLNHEEKYRRNLSITSHVYCCIEMLPLYLVEDKNEVNEGRIFDENVAMILENSKKKNFKNVDLVFFLV